MKRFEEGDRVRIDIPDEDGPDYDRYYEYGVIQDILEDDAGEFTDDSRDGYLFRVDLDDGSTHDFRCRDLRPGSESDS